MAASSAGRAIGRRSQRRDEGAFDLTKHLIIGAALVLVAAGCGSRDTVRHPAAPTVQAESTLWAGDVDVEEEYHQPPMPASGGVGDTITLTGTNIGVRLRVTVTTVKPRARYVQVGLHLQNTGITIFESRMNSAFVQYTNGRRGNPALGVKVPCSHGFEGQIRLEVGRSTTGCVLFRRPADATPRNMRLALETTPASEGGLWHLR
jgi:hypothetical protein